MDIILRALQESRRPLTERPGLGHAPPSSPDPAAEKPKKARAPKKPKDPAEAPAAPAPPAAPPKTPAGPKKAPAPAPAKKAPPPAARARCPAGSRKDRTTGQCRQMSAAEKSGAMANHYHRSAVAHRNAAQQQGLHPAHKAALSHEGEAHASMGLHHDALRRASAAKSPSQKAAHAANAATHRAAADQHYARRDAALKKFAEPKKSMAGRLIHHVGSLFRKKEDIETRFDALVESRGDSLRGGKPFHHFVWVAGSHRTACGLTVRYGHEGSDKKDEFEAAEHKCPGCEGK